MEPPPDVLHAALFNVRITRLHAGSAELHQALQAAHPEWNVSVDRVRQIVHSSQELAPFPLHSRSPPFSRRSMRLLFYLLSLYEQAFVSSLSSNDASRWHPLRHEICLLAAGIKPCCLLWVGPGYHSQNRAKHMQDRMLVDAWVRYVWDRTIKQAGALSNVEPGLVSWLSSVQISRINAGVATGRLQEPQNWHSFTGRVLLYSNASPPHHLALVRWAFLQPHITPGRIIVNRSPPSESLVLVPEATVSAALGYPCTRPAMRGLDHLRTACFIYEDFADGRAVVTGFLAALPYDLNAVLSYLRCVQRTLGDIVPGALNFGVRFEPNGVDQGEDSDFHLQRLVGASGEPLYTPIKPRDLGMCEVYDALRDAVVPTFESVPFRESHAFSVFWTQLREVNVRCVTTGLETF